MSRRTRLFILLAVIGALAVGSIAYTRAKTRRAEAAKAAAAATATPTIELAAGDLVAAGPRELRTALPITGTLKPVNQTVVKTKVAGEIAELLVREGEAVKSGQLVARIDPTEFEWRVKQRQAALASAQASFEMAKKTRENNQALLGKGFISQTAFDNSQSQYDVARANVDAAVAELTLAKKSLDDSFVRAPMAGIVSERHAQAGEKLAVDGRIVTLVDLARMEIEAPVPAERIGQVTIGQGVSLAVEGTGEKLEGRVARINPATTAGTRSVMIYIAVDNSRGAARAGVFAQGQLLLAARTVPVAVPASAVREENGTPTVYVLAQGRIRRQPVTPGMRADNGEGVAWVEVREGLASGTRVVRTNTSQFRDGMVARLGAP